MLLFILSDFLFRFSNPRNLVTISPTYITSNDKCTSVKIGSYDLVEFRNLRLALAKRPVESASNSRFCQLHLNIGNLTGACRLALKNITSTQLQR